MSKSPEMQLAPLRSLDDFLLQSARFQSPSWSDWEKWGNRVASNMIYYQTNYFLLALIIFIIVGVMHPLQMMVGFLVIGLLSLVIWYVKIVTIEKFKNTYPIAFIFIVLVCLYFVLSLFDSLLIVFVGILVPFCAMFVHASLRMRNIHNKLSNLMKNTTRGPLTPMELFFKDLGLQEETF